MKNFGIFGLFLLLILSMGFVTSCDNDDDDVTPDPVLEMTAEEQHDLLYMREEEKLARDVYSYMYTKYGLNVFKNIGKSEQRHMDKLLVIIDKYGFSDPVALSPEVGQFSDADLQALYDALITKGDVSLEEALVVGATIEDVDIFDLDNAIDKTSNADLLEAYANLNCGSRNHLRAFIGQLTDKGITYTPQYISQAQFDTTLDGDHEQCGQ